MKVLVTGAAGFGASGLISALLERGYHVTGLDQVAPRHAATLRTALSAASFHYVWKNLPDILLWLSSKMARCLGPGSLIWVIPAQVTNNGEWRVQVILDI